MSLVQDIYVVSGDTVFMSETTITVSQRSREFTENKRVYMVAVPKYHENLYKHLKNSHDWLADHFVDASMNNDDAHRNVMDHWNKRINDEKEFNKLEKLIQILREEKSELFIDQSYYEKPRGTSLKSYISEFIKSKGIANHYTFSSFYRVTVFPYGANMNYYPQISENEDGEPIYAPKDERQEYIIIPLLIRLKRGKTYSQNKSLGYVKNKEDGSWDYTVNEIPRDCFKRDPLPEEPVVRQHEVWMDDDEEGEEDN